MNVGNVVQVAMAMGFIVSTMAWTFGDFGGAHLNPAVTVSMMACGEVGLFKGNSAYHVQGLSECFLIIQGLSEMYLLFKGTF